MDKTSVTCCNTSLRWNPEFNVIEPRFSLFLLQQYRSDRQRQLDKLASNHILK